MELSRTITLLAHASRVVALTFAAGIALPAMVSSQTAKELIGSACHNELQQREKRTLWSYVAKRRSNSHVFREQVIETLDTPVRHLLAVDGYPPTSSQMKEENDRNPYGTLGQVARPVNTRAFCQPFVNFTFSRVPLQSGQSEAS